MRHDKRADDGKYRLRSSSESRVAEATTATQTHEGRFTHERDCDKRRMPMAATVSFDVPRFKDYRVNRDGYHPKVTK